MATPNTLTAQEKVSWARTQAMLRFPFFAIFSTRMMVFVDEEMDPAIGCTTAYTNFKEIHFLKSYVEKLEKSEVLWVYCHEILHNVFNHCVRQGGRDSYLFNIACDYAINLILDEFSETYMEGSYWKTVTKRPANIYYDKKYTGWSAEKIYDDLMKSRKKIQVSVSMNNSAQGQGGGSSGNKQKPNQGQGQGQGQGQDQNEPNTANNPYASSGGNNYQNDDKLVGNIYVDKNASKEEIEEQIEKWKNYTIEAVNAHKARTKGDLPGSFSLYYGELLAPQIKWTEVMNNWSKKLSKDDYSWRRPNLRYIGNDTYLPCMYSEASGDLVVAIDTSGSIIYVKELLTKFMTELQEIIVRLKPDRVVVIDCDAKVNSVVELTKYDDINDVKLTGGGGTSFKPVFEYVEDNIDDICGLVYFTDLEGDFPNTSPDYPVLWACYNDREYEVPFGQVVKID